MPSELVAETDLMAEWALPSAVTLGSSVRAKGIERELRSDLAWTLRKHLTVEGGRVILRLPAHEGAAFAAISAKVAGALPSLGELPILPRELEDILAISSRERHKWLKDGRLPSVGTRTVKLRGRTKAVTFHLFEPGRIEEILNGDLPALWREDDAVTAADNRRRAAAKAAMRRASKRNAAGRDVEPGEDALEGWDEFVADGLLR